MDELYMDLYVFGSTVSSFEVFFLVGKTKWIYCVLLFKTQDSLHKFCYNLRSTLGLIAGNIGVENRTIKDGVKLQILEFSFIHF